MRIDIVTLFPKMFSGPFEESIVKRAQEKKLVEINIHNLRDWATDKHKTADDRPYGGGAGMIFKVEPVYRALSALKLKVKSAPASPSEAGRAKCKVILLDPGGKVFSQKKAQQLSKLDRIILIAGHYEGVDQRVRGHLIDEEISIGDYILTGGELPAMVVIDSIVRLIPGVLEKPSATQLESFSRQRVTSHESQVTLEHPQYTRPENFKGWKVPKVLLSGNHKKIEEWKQKESLARTKKNRPDLF